MLHIIKKSPYESNALSNSADYIREGDIVLLTEDAVYAAKKNGKYEETIKSIAKNNEVFCLIADTKARGLSESELIEIVKTIDYKGFVEKVVEHNPITWP